MNFLNIIGKKKRNQEKKLKEKEFKILLRELHDLYIDKSKNNETISKFNKNNS